MKKFLALFLALLMALALVPAAVAEAPTEIYLYSVGAFDHPEEMFAEFEAANNCKIVPITVLSEDWAAYMSVAMNGGSQLDVFYMNGQDVRSCAQKGLLVELSQYGDYLDRFYDAPLAPFRVDGGLYAIPYGGGGGMNMCYNQAILDEYNLQLPTNMEELAQVKSVLDEHGIAMFTHEGAVTYMWPSWMFMLLGQATDGKAVETTFATLKGEMKFTDEPYLEAMSVLEKLGKEGYFINGVNALDRQGALQSFINGEALFYYNCAFADTRKGGMGDELQITKGPLFCKEAQEGKVYTTGSASGCPLAIYSGTQNLELSLKLVDWMSDPVNVVKWLHDYTDDQSIIKSYLAPQVNFERPADVEADPLIDILTEQNAGLEVWLDWYWPTDVTTTFKEVLQAVIGGQLDAVTALETVQETFDNCVLDGYVFN